MRAKLLLLFLIFAHTFLLISQIDSLSISASEARLLYQSNGCFHYFIQFFIHLFGQNDYALRLPMVGLHLISVGLLYQISHYFLTRESDKLWLLLVYLLLPGITSAALVVDLAGLKIALTLLFVYGYLRVEKMAYLLLPLYLWIDVTFLPLIIAAMIFTWAEKNYRLAIAFAVLTGIGYWFEGISIDGIPKGHFFDAIGVYAAIFSPIVFIYLFYVLYRRFISNERDLLWMIAAVSFMISLILSFRQKMEIQLFAPFMMVALPLAAQTFLHTYRIRLRMFRGRYRLLFYTALVTLVLNTIAVFFNTYFYHFMKNPTHHFAYPMQIVKELSTTLHAHGIDCITAQDENLQLRLRFYGIEKCANFELMDHARGNAKKVTISYNKIPVYVKYVTKINK